MAKRKPEAAPEEEADVLSSEEEEEFEVVEEEEVEEEEEEVEEEEEEEEEGGEDDGEDDKSAEEEEEEDEEEEEEEDGEEEISKRESIRKLLEPFGKDQLIEFLKEAASRKPSIIQKISDSTESDPVHRKLFVHGLGWDTTNEALAAVFRPFGEIEECNAIMNKTTGKCRGFGFVLFRTRAGAQAALKQPQKKIGNRQTSCQLASFGSVNEAGAGKINLAPSASQDLQSRVPMAMGIGASGLPPNDLALMYAPSSLMGLTGGSLNPASAALLGQGPGIGTLNPTAFKGLSSSVGRIGTNPLTTYGSASGFAGGVSGVNSISPSVIGNYSQAALQGLGSYQSSHLSPASDILARSGLGSYGSSYYGHLG